ncbi:MAG: rRNA maturation RNase YbeY [Deferrisomatales bacterium]|nr:rRNA maturation RNase YbeY [Deferrisomatales bacterium]
MEIWIRNDLPDKGLDEELLRRRTEKLLSALDCEHAELSLWLCSDATIAGLHQEYLGLEGPTNVLSFAQHDGEFGGVEPDLLGDVAVSLDTALRDAAVVGHGLDEEVAFLVVHGVLHLLGFDHEGEQADRAAEMEVKEDTLFRALLDET